MSKNLSPEVSRIKQHPGELILVVGIVLLLIAVYLFQRTDWLHLACSCRLSDESHFIVNKSFRLLINDGLMLWLIHVWFRRSSITRLSAFLQVIDTFILLPFYLFLKLYLEGTNEISSPLLSQLHRLIVNPTLMMLIFPAVYLQRFVQKKSPENI